MSPPSPAHTLLLVDDVTANLQVLVSALEPEGYQLLVASDGHTALGLAARAHPDLILLDIMMPGLSGIEVCRRLKADATLRSIPVIFITALDDWENIVEGFRAGGMDYLVKPFRSEEVLQRVAHHLRLGQLAGELAQKNAELAQRLQELEEKHRQLQAETALRRQTEQALHTADARLNTLSRREAERWGVDRFIGSSPRLQAIVEDIRRLQRSSATSVLITGESGTGKELIARAIHVGSARAGKPFIAVNCVAIPAELAESAFFGHVKGAFTGANSEQKGYFEQADGGTLFLDEIGDMPAGLQAKLLRVLEDGVITPVGGQRSLQTDVRVLSATHVDLPAHIAESRFRADLYYRLARFQLAVPALRERSGDITLLARHFLQLFASDMGIRNPGISALALQQLEQLPFPGNIRELKNLIERALIRSGGAELGPQHLDALPDIHDPAATRPSPAALPSPAPGPALDGVPLNLHEAERVLMQRALALSQGNVTAAARLLGVHRARIYRALAGSGSCDLE